MNIVKQEKLMRICQLFINSHQIRAAENCYQMDKVLDDALEFIEEMCGIVGYYEDEDEAQ